MACLLGGTGPVASRSEEGGERRPMVLLPSISTYHFSMSIPTTHNLWTEQPAPLRSKMGNEGLSKYL